jgi:hypothetical protein
MRTTRELRERLEREAADSGRSLAQEVEARLERSFTSEEGRYLEFGDADTFEFCRLLAQMANMMTATNGKRWKDDPGWFIYVAGAWTEMVKMRESGRLSPGLREFAKLVGGGPDKASDQALFDLGVQAFAAAKMRSNEIEKK